MKNFLYELEHLPDTTGVKEIIKKMLALIGALVLIGGFFVPAQLAQAVSEGDVIINEFSSASETEWVELMNPTDEPIDLDGWKLTEFTSPQEEPVEEDLLVLSGTLPAGGLLVFEVKGLNNPGDSIGLYDNSDTLLHRVTYGIVTGVEETDVDAPSSEESGQLDSDSEEEPWYLDVPTKGWFNDAGEEGKPPLLQDLDLGEDIESNIGDLDNPSATPADDEGALYFGTEDGRVVFEQQLNLTDQAVVELLNSLAELMSMSYEEDSFSPVIYFDSELAEALAAAGARIYMYGVEDLDSQFEVIVKNDDGEVIDPDDEDYPEISDQAYEEGTVSFVTSHFSQFEVDLPVTNETIDVKYPTIMDGVNNASEGDTIRVASGTYEEYLEIWQPLTLVGDVGDDEIGPGNNAPEVLVGGGCSRVLEIEADNVVVKGFKLTGDNCRPVVWFDWEEDGEDPINGVEISDNEISNGRKGVDLTPYSNNNLVTNNRIHDNDNEGVWIGGATNNIVSNNEIYRNSTGVGLGAGGCDEECVGDVSGNEITGNFIHDNENDTSGVHVDGDEVSFSELTISNNSVSGNGSYGIYVEEVEEGTLIMSENEVPENSTGLYIDYIYNGTVLIDGNNISDNFGTGVYVWRIDQGEQEEEPGFSTLTITNNTVAGNGEGGDEQRTGIHLDSVNAGSVMINFNAITENDTGLFVDDTELENGIDATNNWWGNASGPANEENEGGEGDEVGGNVIFSPWLASLNLSGNNPIVGQITNSDNETVGGDTGVKIKFEAEGDNPAETATEEIDSDDQALYEVDIDGPNAGLTTVTGMALFANQDSTLTGELEVVGIKEEEEEDDGGGISSSGSRARPRGTTTPGSAGEEEGEVLGEEKFVFTLFLKKGPPYNLSVQGNEVMELQKLLNSLGFGPLAVDGKFGPQTEAAVKAFQTAHPPLVVDGIVGPLTRAVLNSL